jgi:hypothetical protein
LDRFGALDAEWMVDLVPRGNACLALSKALDLSPLRRGRQKFALYDLLSLIDGVPQIPCPDTKSFSSGAKFFFSPSSLDPIYQHPIEN